MPGLALMGLWGIGGGAVIYLAGLQNIPPHLYEAAEIDGAGAMAKFRAYHPADAVADDLLST